MPCGWFAGAALQLPHEPGRDDFGANALAAPGLVRAHVAPKAATATVLYHSVFWQYMPASKQVELEGLIREIGAKASAEAPFAWLSMEPPPENLATMQVRLIMWPGGEPRILAEVHPHGAYVNWLGGANPS